MNFVRLHDGRLTKRAPCFFQLCVPSVSEEYKMSIFFHTTAKKNKKSQDSFSVKLLVVADEANSELMDSFEVAFKHMCDDWRQHGSM